MFIQAHLTDSVEVLQKPKKAVRFRLLSAPPIPSSSAQGIPFDFLAGSLNLLRYGRTHN